MCERHKGRALIALLGVLSVALATGCSKRPAANALKSDYVYAPITNACRLIERLENPSGATNSVWVKMLDVRGLSAAEFKRELTQFPGKKVHLWMPGQKTWLLVGRATTNKVSLAEGMEVMSAEMGAESITGLFANYVGEREDVLPAFESNLQGEVLPEWFITREVPELKWLDTSGIDDDILKVMLAEMRSVQVVRRIVLEGNVKANQATDRKGEEAATDLWAKAALRNPRDLMLRERLDRLDRNAKGFLEVGKVIQAMKCFETIILIEPKNAAAVHNFGLCLKKLGKTELAEQVLKRSELLAK